MVYGFFETGSLLSREEHGFPRALRILLSPITVRPQNRPVGEREPRVRRCDVRELHERPRGSRCIKPDHL